MNELAVLDDLIRYQEGVVMGLKYALKRTRPSPDDILTLREESQLLNKYQSKRSNIVQTLHSQHIMER